jgi:hypothetical protein
MRKAVQESRHFPGDDRFSMPLFTTLTNERICKEIREAKRHVILSAPGVCMTVAHALENASRRLGRDAVIVVLDVSARAARLGYGEHVAVELLDQAGVVLR